MDKRSDGALRRLEDGRLIRPPSIPRWLLLLAGLAGAGVVLVATGHYQDWGGAVVGAAFRILVVVLVVVVLIAFAALLIYHYIHPLLLIGRWIGAREDREYAAMLAGQRPAVKARGADRAVAWGVFGLLLFPAAGPVAIWYGRDALRSIRKSDGALGGEGMARAGLILGVIDIVYFVLIVIVVTQVSSK